MKKDQAPRQQEMKKQIYIQRLLRIQKGREIKNMSNQEKKQIGIKDSKDHLHSEGILWLGTKVSFMVHVFTVVNLGIML